jgi:glucosamine--fructose-6-phosphate aminotransferase (isomerizing)
MRHPNEAEETLTGQLQDSGTTPGALMAKEVADQPRLLAGLVEHRAEIASVAKVIAERKPRFALLAARGSSDNAALYAKYLIEVLLQLPAGLVSPSTTTLYGAAPDLTDVLLVTVSQSGGSPDLVEVTDSARKRGALTVAVTNTEGSDLGGAAEFEFNVRAGRELAVAATKSYTSTLLGLYLLIDAIRGGDGHEVANIGELAESTLSGSAADVAEAAQRYRFVERMVTTGRGYSLSTALEASLKLAETSYLSARAYSGADLLHGPVAALDSETGVIAVTSTGKGADAMREVLGVVHGRGADVLAVGSAAKDMPAAGRLNVATSAEEVAPILEVLPIQRLALELSLARGGDPDQPRGLKKVTKTR